MTYPKIMPAITLDFQNSQQLDPRVTFSRTQATGKTTYINSAGQIVYADEHEPRFDHDPITGEPLGLLIEESRKNYLPQSNWSLNAAGPPSGIDLVIDENSPDIAAPDGTFTATHITATKINYLGPKRPIPDDQDVGKYFTFSYWVYLKSCTPVVGAGTDTDNTIGIGITVNGNDGGKQRTRTVEKNT